MRLLEKIAVAGKTLFKLLSAMLEIFPDYILIKGGEKDSGNWKQKQP